MSGNFDRYRAPYKVVDTRTDTASGNVTFTVPPQTKAGTFALKVTAASGTTPTLDFFIQASYDGVASSLTDIGRFPQLTTTGDEAYMGIGMTSNAATPFVKTNGTLAVATSKVIDLPPNCNAKFTIAGTTPSFTWELWFTPSSQE